VFEKGVVGPSPSEKAQGAKAEAGDAPARIVDAGRQSHGALQPGEARSTSQTPSEDDRDGLSVLAWRTDLLGDGIDR